MATLVTGYVRLDNAHRGHDRYLELGRRIIGLGLPTMCFYDGPAGDVCPTPATTVRGATLESCWLYGDSRRAMPPVLNSGKDTTNYCVVQHQKSAWLAEACRLTGGTCVWVDFGIFHLANLADRDIVEFFDRVVAAAPQRITLPSCWPLTGRPRIEWTSPAWYVAGGAAVMPPHAADWFHAQCVDVATLQIEVNRRATWEVNTWSVVARDHRDWFELYAADHDRTIFTGYRGAA
jgi:hypothetical protein